MLANTEKTLISLLTASVSLLFCFRFCSRVYFCCWAQARLRGGLRAESDEAEPTREPRHPMFDHDGFHNLAEAGKAGFELLGGHGAEQSADENFALVDGAATFVLAFMT